MSFKINVRSGNDASILGRITARNGSGASTGVDGEGNWLQQADISSITYQITQLEAPTTVTFSGTLTVSTVIDDTPADDNVWTEDGTGYNFVHDIAASNFPESGVVVLIEYTVTLSGGAVLKGQYQGPVC